MGQIISLISSIISPFVECNIQILLNYLLSAFSFVFQKQLKKTKNKEMHRDSQIYHSSRNTSKEKNIPL